MWNNSLRVRSHTGGAGETADQHRQCSAGDRAFHSNALPIFKAKDVNEDSICRAVEELRREGAQVVVGPKPSESIKPTKGPDMLNRHELADAHRRGL
jgi:hypothetical protein